MKKLPYLLLPFVLALALCACGGGNETTGNATSSTATKEPAVHTHAFGEWETIVNATCTETGLMQRDCSCGEIQEKQIAATGHTKVVDNAVAATCTTTGLTEGKHCSTCNEILVKQDVIKAYGHNVTVESEIAATCTSEGTINCICSVCKYRYTEQTDKLDHTYTSEITVDATCSSEGVKTYTCSVCNYEYTESIAKIDHLFESEIIIEATCSSVGEKVYTCTECGYYYTEKIETIAHTYTSAETTPATCTSTGIMTYTCTECGYSYTQSTSALGHDMNSSGVCNRCGIYELNMTSSEIANANSVQYLGDRSIWHQDDKGRYVLVFSLKDSDRNMIAAPCIVEITIVNDNGETVYSSTKVVKTSWFQYWTYSNGTEKYQASIYIYDDDIAGGQCADGDIYFTVYNDGYFSFDQSTLSIDDLPQKDTTIDLPETPHCINYYSSSGKLKSACEITGVTIDSCKKYSDGLWYEITFTGSCTYNASGSGQSSSMKIGWKLYNSEGYVVDSGTAYTESVAMGEKFRETINVYYLTPGETYTLVILNVN